MTRRRIGLAVVIVALVAGLAVAWSSCRGGSRGGARTAGAGTTSGHAGAGGASLRGSNRVDVATVARGTIEGTVRDPAGAPVARATVCGYAYSDEVPEDAIRDPFCTATGADGRYRLTELLPARYEIHAQAPRFVPGSYETKTADGRDERGLRLAAGESRDGIDIALGAGGVEVHGIVKDIGGGPVGGAWVYLRAGRQWGPRSGGVATVQSQADGTFVAWIAPGRIHASAEADGYASGDKEAVAPGQTIEILLTPESVLAGRVIEKDGGAPVAGARVTVGGDWSDGTGWASTMSDADGQFRLTRLSPGRYKPSATAAARRGQAAESVLLGLGHTVEGIVIEVHPASMITGRVVLPDGATPCPEGWVTLRDSDRGNGETGRIEEDGRVEIEAALPGTYEVKVHCAGYRGEDEYPALVVVAGTEVPEQLWKVAAGAQLRGVVLSHDGTPAGKARVSARATASEDPWDSWESAVTEDDGSFEIDGMNGGPYDVTASRDGEPSTEDPVKVVVPADGEATVELRLAEGGAIAGTVRDEDGVAVARVHVRAQGKQWGWNGDDTTLTLDDGSFRIDGVRTGPHRVTAARDAGWGSALRAPGKTDDDLDGEKVEVRAGQTTQVALVVESQSGVIRGRVVDGAGAAITDAFLDAERESESAAAAEGGARRAVRWGWSRAPILTDTTGDFAIEHLSKGTYTVRAYRKGGGEALAEHVAVGATVTMTIRATGSIAGRVSLDGGGAPDQLTVSVRDGKTGLRRREEYFRTDGAFVMRDLPGGDYQVTASSSQGTGKAQVSLAEGQDLTGLAITLSARATVAGRLVTADDGKPLAGYMIMTAAVGPMEGMTFDMASGGPPTSDADGRFEVKNAPAGRVQLMAYPMTSMEDTPYPYVRRFFTLEGGKTTDVGDVKVPRMRAKMGEDAGDLGFELKSGEPGADPETEKLLVAIVRPDGPAAPAGLKVGDEIVAVDGQDVRGDSFLFWTHAFVPPGTTITLGLQGGATVAITAGPPRL